MFKRLNLLAALFLPLFAHAATLQVQTWQGGAKGAHTIAHDDYCSPVTSGIEQNAIPILNQRGLKASLGLIAGSCSDAQWQTLKTRISQGHELFNHTLTHRGMLEPGSLAPISDWDNVKEIVSAQQLVLSKLGYTMHFVAFPSDLATPEAKAFVEAMPETLGVRAAKHLYDGKAAGVNEADDLQAMFVKWDSYWRDGKWSLYKPARGNILIQHAQAAIDDGVWTYATMHGVADASWESVPVDQYTAYADFLAAKVKSGELWVAGPSDILRYQMTRQYCPLQLSGDTIKADTSDARCKRYASPITVDIKLDEQQQGIFTQQGKTLTSQLLDKKTARLSVNPLLGEVKIK
ncbi:polysaccharide deacetylase family protein [Chitinibacter fontanus]|uniref:Polysaccharide deacetylase family protein n=1 Tax=Chitinibacter fontanus TaxID=1737446 RepID=A0A7D5Z1U8_9NEIS|nr:polysaccharide deacetylase family protein [Chitinibacter fontanus]QLI80881.1 polysaccharide deacetylase family protein [Chitinibacter fontanus]